MICQVKSESTNLRSWYTMGYPFLRGYRGALGTAACKHLSSVPFCVPDVYTRYTCLPLRTPCDSLPKLRQVFSPNTQDTSVALRWKLPPLNPILDGTRGHLQQFRNFLGRIDSAYFGRFWQDRRLFPRWHTQPCSFKVVSLGRISLNLTEELCTLKTHLKIHKYP